MSGSGGELLQAARYFSAGVFLVALIRWVKLAGHLSPGERRRGLRLSPLDGLVLLGVAFALSGSRGWGGALVGTLVFSGALLLLGGMWIDAVLFRVYTIELGLEGVRAIVLPVLYRELSEVAFARRFFRDHRAFSCLPLFAAAAFLPLDRPGLAALAVAAATCAGFLWMAGEALFEWWLLVWVALFGACSVAGALAPPAVFPWLILVVAALGILQSAGAPPSAIWAFLVPRRMMAGAAFVPRPEHARAVARDQAPPEPSARHGLLRGESLVLWTFESMGRDHLRAYGGRAELPFLEGLVERSPSSDNHFAPCAFTNDAHLALYASDYAAALGFPPLQALGAAGYRRIYLTSYRTAYYGLEKLLRRAGFDRVVDRGDLPAGGGDRALLSRGLPLVTADLSGGPFFLHVHTSNSHLPYRVEDRVRFSRFAQEDDYGRYLNSLEEGDALLREMMAALRGTAGGEPLWVVSADHGQAFGELGYRAHGSAVVKEEVNVPCLFHHSRLPPERFAWSSHLDLLPTALDLLGVAVTGPCRGRSLFWPPREPLLVLSAGRPARSRTSNLGLIIGDRKYMLDLVLDRCLQLTWRDEGSELSGEEGRYVRSLLARAFDQAGLR